QLSSTQLTVIVKNGVGSSINVTDAFALYGSSVSTAASVKGTNVVPSGIGVVVGANEEVTMIYTVSGPAAATAYSATANLTYTVMDTGLTFTSSGTLTGTST
ncbi:MAG: hypothetical protein KKC05_03345, partial [Nanoarchaeota archaeon]|nr:hypothetical protein [Nanoarchaeota archaeon]